MKSSRTHKQKKIKKSNPKPKVNIINFSQIEKTNKIENQNKYINEIRILKNQNIEISFIFCEFQKEFFLII